MNRSKTLVLTLALAVLIVAGPVTNQPLGAQATAELSVIASSPVPEEAEEAPEGSER